MSIITPPQTISENISGTTIYYEDIFAFIFEEPTLIIPRILWYFNVTDVKLNNKSNILYIPRGTQNVNLSFNYYSYIKELHPEVDTVVVGNPALYLNISWYIGPVTGQAVTPILSRAMNTLYDSAEYYWLRDIIYGPSTKNSSFSGIINIPDTVPGDVYYITHTYDFNSAPSGTKQFSTNSQPIAAIILMDPIFDTLPTRTIYDDTEAGTIVYKININDSFHQNYTNFKIEYSLIEIEDYLSFIIDLATGDVLLLKPQLSRVKSSYTFSINANIIGTYKGAFINYDEILQSIVINNISRQSSGDGTTIVDPIFLTPPPVSISIYDDILPGTLVYGANVYNQEGNPLLFSFTNLSPNVGTDFSNFIINPVSGDVSIITPKSKSDKPSYSFVIKVIDTITKKSALESITITNNERLGPKFYSPTIQLNTYEDAPDFTLVYGARVKTQKGSSLQFSFDISGNTATRNLNINDSSNFIIDSTTGEVRIIKSQSVTSTTAYNFKISVKDTITNLGDTQLLTITNNYGTPYFLDGPEMTITVYDDIDIANEIYIPNLNYTTDLIYNLLNDIFDNKYFYISDVSGHVFFKNQPSAEGIKQYTFQIKATNTINNKYATQQVLVNIKKRPQPPYFTDILYNIQINDPIELGKLIYKFTAVSPDNNKLRYDVIGDDNYEFNIDKFGQLTFENSPTVRDYHIKIKVTDLINSENVTSDNITIKVNNVSHFIGGENIIINIDDTYPDNSLIYTSKLIYKNVLGGITTYSYSINPGDDSTYFTITINQGQGQIYIKNTPNFNIKSTYKFQISGDYESRITDYIIRSNILLQNITVNVLQNENFTSCSQTPPDPPNLWSRATLSCVDYDVYSQEEFAMRQKAEVLKYKGNKNPLTKKQQFSRNVNGNGPLGKKVWATQNDLGSNPNVFNLPQVGNTLILCPNNDTEDKYFAYVTNYYNANILAYTINPATGELTAIADSPFLTGIRPSSISIDPTRKFAYVTNYGNANFSAYTINPATGALTAIAGSPFPAEFTPSSISIDPNGKFAYVTNALSDNVSAYTINLVTGVLTSIAGSPFFNGTGTIPISVIVDPTGKFVYVTNEFTNDISAYTINPSTGALIAIAGSPFPTGLVPVSISIDPTGKFAYVTNFSSQNVSAYTINPATGALTGIAGSPFSTGTNPSSVIVDPTGKFVYVTNEFTNDISAYTINPATGALIAIAGSPFFNGAGTKPRRVTVDPTGKFAYVTNFDSNNVSAYTINQTTGALTTISGSPFPAGTNPDSIITVRISGNKTNVKCEPSSSSDVPGNSILCYDPAVPLVNYLPPPRTYLAGGTKWPQYTWKPGDNGFPRGKKGSMNMLFQ